MLDAAVKALSQMISPPMRSILWRSIGLALVLITVPAGVPAARPGALAHSATTVTAEASRQAFHFAAWQWANTLASRMYRHLSGAELGEND